MRKEENFKWCSITCELVHLGSACDSDAKCEVFAKKQQAFNCELERQPTQPAVHFIDLQYICMHLHIPLNHLIRQSFYSPIAAVM